MCDEPKCDVCGIEFHEHPGLQTICAQLKIARADVENLRRRLQQMNKRAQQAEAYEREACAAMVEEGTWCKPSDHMQGICDCADIARAIRRPGH